VGAPREGNISYLYALDFVSIRVNERGTLLRTLSSREERARSVLWKEFERRHGAPTCLPASPPSPDPVISSCTKLVKIPPVCPSLQPAQCGNHLTGRKAERERERERERKEGRGGEREKYTRLVYIQEDEGRACYAQLLRCTHHHHERDTPA